MFLKQAACVFLGGLTTFSAFSLELHDLLRTGRHFAALVTFSVNLAGSLGMVFLGFTLFKRVMR